MKIAKNNKLWDKDYKWKDDGNEWSIPWGGAEAQWQSMIMTRIGRFLPTNSVLEIACGHGRWSKFLIDYSNEFTGIDLSQKGIEICKNHFNDNKKAKFYKNDGKSLDMIKENSIDFIFSCDSLVHVDLEVMESYLSQFGAILRKNGIAFLHHSNLAQYKNLPQNADIHARDFSVSGKLIEKIANKYGLVCISQEKIKWISLSQYFIDCFTILTKKDSIYERENRIISNRNFVNEIKNSLMLSKLYSPNNNQQYSSLKDILYLLRSLAPLKLNIQTISKFYNIKADFNFVNKLNLHIQKYKNLDFTAYMLNFIENKNFTKFVVYGGGEIFFKFENLLTHKNKIAFIIDKKAENGKYKLLNYDVLPKNSLLNHQNLPIIITSFSFADEIKNELQEFKNKNLLKNEIFNLVDFVK